MNWNNCSTNWHSSAPDMEQSTHLDIFPELQNPISLPLVHLSLNTQSTIIIAIIPPRAPTGRRNRTRITSPIPPTIMIDKYLRRRINSWPEIKLSFRSWRVWFGRGRRWEAWRWLSGDRGLQRGRRRRGRSFLTFGLQTLQFHRGERRKWKERKERRCSGGEVWRWFSYAEIRAGL